MKITLSAGCFNTIMKTCKPFVAKDDRRPILTPILTRIRLICDGESVTAVALDNAYIVRLTLPCEKGSDTGKMLVPLMKPVGKTVRIVCLSDTDKEITADTGEGRQTFCKLKGASLDFEEKYFDHTRFFPKDDPKDVFWFDPKRLANALSVFSEGWVKIEAFEGGRGFVLSDSTKRALVLPVRKHED